MKDEAYYTPVQWQKRPPSYIDTVTRPIGYTLHEEKSGRGKVDFLTNDNINENQTGANTIIFFCMESLGRQNALRKWFSLKSFSW